MEQRDNPTLEGQPVIVGSPPTQRGVVCAASYEARKFGVRSAMPSVTAGRLCPNGVFLKPRMEAYRAESKEIMATVQEFTGERIQQVSVDEAKEIYRLGCWLLARDKLVCRPLRLIGLGVSGLVETRGNQLSLPFPR